MISWISWMHAYSIRLGTYKYVTFSKLLELLRIYLDFHTIYHEQHLVMRIDTPDCPQRLYKIVRTWSDNRNRPERDFRPHVTARLRFALFFKFINYFFRLRFAIRPLAILHRHYQRAHRDNVSHGHFQSITINQKKSIRAADTFVFLFVKHAVVIYHRSYADLPKQTVDQRCKIRFINSSIFAMPIDRYWFITNKLIVSLVMYAVHGFRVGLLLVTEHQLQQTSPT